MQLNLDALGLGLFVVTMIAAVLLVPDLSVELLGQPAFYAIVGGAALLTAIVVLRSQGRRGTPIERTGLAVFLFLMPTIYLASWLRSGAASGTWLWVELAGQVAFATLAVLGARRSPWLLALGIGAHGLLWDVWHHGRAPFVPDWYPLACAVADLGAACYIATQVGAWRAASHGPRGAS